MIVATLIGGLIVVGVVLLIFSSASRPSLWQRVGLCVMAAGLAWSGPGAGLRGSWAMVRGWRT